jgi:putative pyruvate formate lyase activating enzyme
LARDFLSLQAEGAANINLVSPTHFLIPILRALRTATREGLRLPVVFNSNGYESVAVLRELEGIVDIWLPDLKYFDSALAGSLSGAPDYFKIARAALIEMYCQQPVLDIDASGLATRGLIVRHLVLPGHKDDSLRILDWIHRRLSPSIGLSLMSQFYPCHEAPPELRRTVTYEEYTRVVEHAETLGFDNLFVQPEMFSGGENLIPDFGRPEPFQWDHGGPAGRRPR